MAGVSSVIIKIGAETASAVSSIREVDGALEKTQTTGQKFASGIQRAAIPAAAALTALTGVAVVSAKAAAEDAASRQQLDSQIQRSIGSSKEAIATNEEWVASLSRSVAVSNEELRPALAGAVRATGDLSKAHELLKLGLDTSAATGKPLASVMTALQKGYNGSTGALKKLVPSLSDSVLKTKDWAFIQGVLNKQVEGAAVGKADTAAGQYKKMQLAMHELTVEIGTALLPVMSAFLPIVTEVLGVFGRHTDAIVAVAGAVAAVAAAVVIANAAISIYEGVQAAAAIATGVWTAAQWLLNAALDANPIGLAIIAVAALTAGIVLAYKHSATFRGIVQGAFGAAKSAIIALQGPLSAVIGAMRALWNATGPLRGALTSVFHAIEDAVSGVVHAFGRLLDAAGRVKGVLVGAFNSVVDAINGLISAIESVIGAIGRIHFPSKPSWVPFAVPAGAGTFAAPVGGMVVNVQVSGAIDPESTAIAIRRTLDRYDRRRGRAPLGGARD